MKYWRGYLTAAIFGFFTWALMKFGETHAVLIDMVYPYVSRMLQNYLAQWSSSAAFCVWQVVAVALVVGVLASIVLMIILRWNPIQWFGWILAGASFLFFLHTGLYGLNSYAGPLADDVRLELRKYTVEELEEATAYYRDLANELAVQISRDGKGDPDYQDFAVLAQQVVEGFDTLTYQNSISVFAGSRVPVKKLGWADMYTSMGITGLTMPLTGEAAVNPQIPDVSLPFVMCHEMAHRVCIAVEGDANFAAFLACRANSQAEIRYSGYFMAYRYCRSALYRADSQAAARVSAGESEALKRDMAGYNTFFAAHEDKKATELANKANDTYIKASGDQDGITSYGRVCDELVSLYIQEIVVPQQKEDAPKFDPYDENQVDLTGLIPEPKK